MGGVTHLGWAGTRIQWDSDTTTSHGGAKFLRALLLLHQLAAALAGSNITRGIVADITCVGRSGFGDASNRASRAGSDPEVSESEGAGSPSGSLRLRPVGTQAGQPGLLLSRNGAKVSGALPRGHRRLAGSEPKARSALRTASLSRKRGGIALAGRTTKGCSLYASQCKYMPANPDLPFLYGHGERHGTGERRREGSKLLKSSPATRSHCQWQARVARGSAEKICRPRAAASGRPATRWASSRRPLIKLGSHAERREGGGFTGTCAPDESGGERREENKPPSSAGLW